MAITDIKVANNAALPLKTISLSPDAVPISQAAALFAAVTPGFRFEITAVEVFCRATVATASVDVQINGTTVLTGLVTPVAGSLVAGTLVTTRATRRGTSANPIQVKVTTNGTGTITGLMVNVTYRAYPSANEA